MTSPIYQSYFFLSLVLTILTLILAVASLVIGYIPIPLTDALTALVTGGETSNAIIMREIRLPRMILAVLIGAVLGLSGAVLQGFLRNPLAESGILGVGAAASLGAVIAIYSGLSALWAFALPLAAQTGALIAVLILYLLSGRRTSMLTLILAGVAITSMAGALTSLALNLSDNPYAALEIVFWMLGSLEDRSMHHVLLAAPFILLSVVMLLLTAKALYALSLGEEVAQSLGINLSRTRFLAITGTALGVGAATAVAGVIGFIGLVIPHLLRPLVGHNPMRLLPISALGGASFLLIADILTRVILVDRDLKLGVVTALVGAPFFLWLLLKTREAT
ncbi:MAG TPA: iron ABC transporter permease [Thiotrichaceae bacterium]|nr:iron ABC transporter permease [Thiotrichaceae bacterium]